MTLYPAWDRWSLSDVDPSASNRPATHAKEFIGAAWNRNPVAAVNWTRFCPESHPPMSSPVLATSPRLLATHQYSGSRRSSIFGPPIRPTPTASRKRTRTSGTPSRPDWLIRACGWPVRRPLRRDRAAHPSPSKNPAAHASSCSSNFHKRARRDAVVVWAVRLRGTVTGVAIGPPREPSSRPEAAGPGTRLQACATRRSDRPPRAASRGRPLPRPDRSGNR